MVPSQMILALDQITAEVSAALAQLKRECAHAETQYRTLKRLTGAREDDAANLMAALVGPLRRLELYCQNVQEQIAQMIAQPYAFEKE